MELFQYGNIAGFHLNVKPCCMAEIIGSKKTALRVDLTPMVDLGFLLISFFMITTSLADKKAMQFFLPADGPPSPTGESTTLTLVPMGDHRVAHFQGSIDWAIEQHALGTTGFSGEGGVRDLILGKQAVLRKSGKEKDFMVIINPDTSCSYQTLVDLFDELQINQVKRYSLVNNEAELAAIRKELP